MIEIQDGPRTLKFEGHLISQSSSYAPGKHRWIEFNLYRTLKGTYVISRIGQSVLVHTSVCSVVRRNNIDEAPRGDINTNTAITCRECEEMYPEYSTVYYPEVARHWASVSDSAEAVVDNLYKEDYNQNRYLTEVARRLLEDAAKVDQNIFEAYLTEYID